MIFYGNVVRFKQKPKELYVVKEAKYEGKNLDSIVLIPFDYGNSSTHISRKHPLKRKEYISDDCKADVCEHYQGECPWEYVPSPIFNIDEVEWVSGCVTDFIMNKMKKAFFE